MNDGTRRLFLILSLLVAGGGLAFIAFGNIGENLVYYWNPTEIIQHGDEAYGADIRLGGVVKEGTVNWDEDLNELNFDISDGTTTLRVHVKGAPPQMFRPGIGVLVEGTMTKAGIFESDRLMVKHSNEYKAPENGKDVSELYKTVDEI